jgi:hypothetical protein
MHTPAGSRPGLAEAARNVAEHATAIARLELQLATQEVKRKAKTFGVGLGLLLGAAFVALLIVPLLLGAAVAGIAVDLPVWASFLIVAGAVTLVAVPLAVVGVVLLKRGSPPVPEQALAEARLTTEALRNGSR